MYSKSSRLVASWLLLAVMLTTAPTALGQVLVGDVFRTGFEGWTDVNGHLTTNGHIANWGVLLTGEKFLFEQSNDIAVNSGKTVGGVADGKYTPYLMINNAVTSPTHYTINATMATYDDDGLGVVFGYVDEQNYFRMGMRSQGTGSLGFQQGTSVQKVVNGVATQIYSDTPIDHYIDGTEFDVSIVVAGHQISVTVEGYTHDPITDADLQPGKYGVHSWAQRTAVDNASPDPQYGTMVHQIGISSATVNDNTNFDDAVVANWRPLTMVNNLGLTGTLGEHQGNFRQDFRHGTIVDDSNGFLYATSNENVDFIGPAVVIDEVGSEDWSDYRMNVRMENTDNDGIGLLFRVEDDNSFYRMNFTNESMGANTTLFRTPRGMSIQKNDNGVWTEVFRDDQSNPKFVFQPGVPFDVSLTAVGNTFGVEIINDPDGTPTAIVYDPIQDSTNPIFSGSVGFANWGSGKGNLNASYSAYGGGSSSLLTVVTNPTVAVLTVDRLTGEVTLTNGGEGDLEFTGLLIGSGAGALDPAQWTAISGNYDEMANGGDGSVDSNDPWTVLAATALELREEEATVDGDGGVLAPGTSVNLGTPWIKSSIEDLSAVVRLADGSLAVALVDYLNDPLARSDLNTDGLLTIADFQQFYPNLLTDISGLTAVEQALLGDLDGDGDVDVEDFSLFKLDFELAMGPGALDIALQKVPEPGSVALLLLAGFAGAVCRYRSCGRTPKLMAAAVAALTGGLVLSSEPAQAQPLDLTTFTAEAYPLNATFGAPSWSMTPIEARHASNVNSSASVLYAPGSAYNKRYIGRLTPGIDDDVVGFVLGFEPGDATRQSADIANADYLLIDWKGLTQTFNFDDLDELEEFTDLTPSGSMPVGLALSRVTNGVPTADEMWQHDDLDNNFEGKVTELARGATLGELAYPRDNTSVLFDIRYSPTNVTVSVDGVEQFNLAGSFSDGSFGFYSAWQGPSPRFSNWEIVPDDFTGLSATVDRGTGEIVIANAAGTAMEFDYYEFTSAQGALNAGIGNSANQWASLNLGEADSPGQGWEEAGGASATAIAEVNLESSLSVSGETSFSIGSAYNTQAGAEDLAFRYRLPGSGLMLNGSIAYVGVSPTGLDGDFNDDGVVDAADYTVWRNHLGAADESALNGNGDGLNGVDAADYTLWKNNFGESNMGALIASGATVPEPSTWVLMVVGAGVFVACRVQPTVR